MQTSKSADNGATKYSALFMLLVTICFFLSGLAGLIYEVIWARQLSLFLGITSFAHTAVITAYMAGLAAGSLYFGSRADQHAQPLRLYAWLEIGVGVYAALTPWLFSFLQSVYVGVGDFSTIGETSGHLTRFTIALLALLVPTFMMGGTLPLLVRGFVTELPELGSVTSKFYGINTLGAVIGTLAAGYWLLPWLGVTASVFVGVAINLVVAFIVLAMLHKLPAGGRGGLPRFAPAKVQDKASRPDFSDNQRRLVLLGFGVVGFAALLTQMAWIRAFILVVGGSVYAFTITLAGFLTGIAIGSLVYHRFLSKPRGRCSSSWLSGDLVTAALLTAFIGLALLLGLPVIGKLPEWFLAGYAAGLSSDFALFQLFIFALCFCVMILPTLLMGVLFPMVAVIWTRRTSEAGHAIGTAYAINTTGTILGALLGGLLILPWLGIHQSIVLAAVLYFLVAIVFLLGSHGATHYRHRFGIAGLVVLLAVTVVWWIPPWNKALMMSGVFLYSDSLTKNASLGGLQATVDRNELLYYKEGLDGTVAVRDYGDNRALVINGKTDASSVRDLATQVMLGQLPLALDRNAKNALVIGLGSGITAGTLATDKALEKITILEISDEVVEAASFFEVENYHVLNNPKVKLVTADARNFLMASPETYDLIVSEPSNPWITGISNLFTDEFFKLSKSRLSPGGIMTQWFHTYGMSNADLRVVLKTFDENFQYVSVWSSIFEDLLIVGSDQPYALSLGPSGHMAKPEGQKELNRAQVNSERDLVRLYLVGGEALSSYVNGARINSDYHPVIEFNAPKNIYSNTTRQNIVSMFEYLAGRKEAVPVTGGVRQSGEYLDVDFMGLRVNAGAEAAATGLTSQWLVSHSVSEKDGDSAKLIVGSERVVRWQEGLTGFRLHASWLPDNQWFIDILRVIEGKDGKQSGITYLPDGTKAFWLMKNYGLNSQGALEVSWLCPAQPDGFTHFKMSMGLPDSARESWGGALDVMAGRLSCHAGSK